LKELASRLTWVDCVVFIALVRGIYIGYRSGLFPELMRVVGYIVTVFVAFYLNEFVAQYLTLNTFLNETSAQAISLAGLLAVTFALTKFIVFLFLKLLKVGDGGTFYRVLGAGVGACRWMILVSLIFMIIEKLPLGPLKSDIHDRSFSGAYVAKVGPVLFDFASNLAPQFGGSAKKAG
jgi:membrane protein required for colicin V production